MRDTAEFPAEQQPGAARTAGLHRLSRLTWRATQLSAVTAVGLATLFARTAPAQTAAPAGDSTAAPAATTPPPAASSPGQAHRKRARATASASPQATAQPGPQAAAQGTAKASPAAAAPPSKSATLAPPTTAPAAPPPSSAPAPAPTVSSTSHGGG